MEQHVRIARYRQMLLLLRSPLLTLQEYRQQLGQSAAATIAASAATLSEVCHRRAEAPAAGAANSGYNALHNLRIHIDPRNIVQWVSDVPVIEESEESEDEAYDEEEEDEEDEAESATSEEGSDICTVPFLAGKILRCTRKLDSSSTAADHLALDSLILLGPA